MIKRILALLLALLCIGSCALGEALVYDGAAITDELLVEYGQDYYYYDEVALYLHVFEELPPNYITKEEAQYWGWDSGDDLWDTSYGYCIGGNKFGNREGALPKAKNRQYYECDVNYFGGDRNADRLIFSNDGLIYYTEDHYHSFELLYEDWYHADGWYPWN